MKLEAGDSSVKREAGDSSQGSQGSGGVKVESIDSSADAEAEDDDRKGPMASPVGSPRSSPVEQQPAKRQKRTAVKAAAKARPSGPHYARAHGSVGAQRSADAIASRGATLSRTTLTPWECRQEDIRAKHVAVKAAVAVAAAKVKVEDGVWHLLDK